MITNTTFRQHPLVRSNSNNPRTILIILATVLLTAFSWGGEAFAKDKFARVGILSFSEAENEPRLAAVLKILRQTLANHGWIDGKNVSYVYQSARSNPSRFSEAAKALVELDVDVIVAGSAPALRAAYGATRTIPIVAGDFTTDAIADGYIRSYARPGGNVTGVFLDAPEIAGKWFELLNATIPDLSRVAVLWDPGPGAVHLKAVRNVAASLDIELQVVEIRKPEDIETAFDVLHGEPQAVVMLPSPLIYGQSAQLARLTLKHRLPATSMARGFAIGGGVIAYGPEIVSSWERMAVLAAKVLSGSSPAEIPVERPEKIELVVNLRSAKLLGLTIPQLVLLRADEIIR